MTTDLDNLSDEISVKDLLTEATPKPVVGLMAGNVRALLGDDFTAKTGDFAQQQGMLCELEWSPNGRSTPTVDFLGQVLTARLILSEADSQHLKEETCRQATQAIAADLKALVPEDNRSRVKVAPRAPQYDRRQDRWVCEVVLAETSEGDEDEFKDLYQPGENGLPPEYQEPGGLTPKGHQAWECIVSLLARHNALNPENNGQVFYNPDQVLGLMHQDAVLAISCLSGTHLLYLHQMGGFPEYDEMVGALKEIGLQARLSGFSHMVFIEPLEIADVREALESDGLDDEIKAKDFLPTSTLRQEVQHKLEAEGFRVLGVTKVLRDPNWGDFGSPSLDFKCILTPTDSRPWTRRRNENVTMRNYQRIRRGLCRMSGHDVSWLGYGWDDKENGWSVTWTVYCDELDQLEEAAEDGFDDEIQVKDFGMGPTVWNRIRQFLLDKGLVEVQIGKRVTGITRCEYLTVLAVLPLDYHGMTSEDERYAYLQEVESELARMIGRQVIAVVTECSACCKVRFGIYCTAQELLDESAPGNEPDFGEEIRAKDFVSGPSPREKIIEILQSHGLANVKFRSSPNAAYLEVDAVVRLDNPEMCSMDMWAFKDQLAEEMASAVNFHVSGYTNSLWNRDWMELVFYIHCGDNDLLESEEPDFGDEIQAKDFGAELSIKEKATEVLRSHGLDILPFKSYTAFSGQPYLKASGRIPREIENDWVHPRGVKVFSERMRAVAEELGRVIGVQAPTYSTDFSTLRNDWHVHWHICCAEQDLQDDDNQDEWEDESILKDVVDTDQDSIIDPAYWESFQEVMSALRRHRIKDLDYCFLRNGQWIEIEGRIRNHDKRRLDIRALMRSMHYGSYSWRFKDGGVIQLGFMAKKSKPKAESIESLDRPGLVHQLIEAQGIVNSVQETEPKGFVKVCGSWDSAQGNLAEQLGLEESRVKYDAATGDFEITALAEEAMEQPCAGLQAAQAVLEEQEQGQEAGDQSGSAEDLSGSEDLGGDGLDDSEEPPGNGQ